MQARIDETDCVMCAYVCRDSRHRHAPSTDERVVERRKEGRYREEDGENKRRRGARGDE